MAFSIGVSEDPRSAFSRIAEEQFNAALLHLEPPIRDEKTAIHEVRRHCKKVRGLLRLFAPALDAREFRVSDVEIRDAARILGFRRDAAVRAEIFDNFGIPHPPEPDHNNGGNEAIALATRHLTRARVLIASISPSGNVRKAVASGFRNTYKRCLKANKLARRRPSDELDHKLRKWVKYHWQHLLLLSEFSPPNAKERRKLVRQVGHLLGLAHDIFVIEAEPETQPFSEQLAEKKAGFIADARQLINRVSDSDGARFTKRVARQVRRSRA